MDYSNNSINRSNSSISTSQNKNDQIIKLILEENKILKKTISQKFPNEAILLSLLDLLEIQRNRLDNLEEGIL
jgi:hypothetical protein